MTTNQQQLDRLLDRIHNVPVLVHSDGPIPTTSTYQPVRSIVQNGISFSTRELIQAIGCKMANLPLDKFDECLNYAWIYAAILNLESPYLVYKEDVGYSSDFQIFYSEGIGVGITCLIATKYLGIPYDQLEPIPGPGTRFDYRGQSGNLKCIFESRGTKYIGNQIPQVEWGMDKKAVCNKREDKFDISLVISAFIGLEPKKPQIIIADPKYTGKAFWGNSAIYYRYRHFARVMQFIGATPLSRALYLESTKIPWGMQSKLFFFKDSDPYSAENMTKIEVDNSFYIGHWVDNWVPKESFRYRRLKSIKLPSLLESQPKMKISVFQGLLDANFQAIINGRMEKISIPSGENLASIKETKNGDIASVFPDGTALIFREKS